MKVKQVFLHKPYDLRIREVELPPIKPNEVLVKVYACGICGSDVACYTGESSEGRYDIQPYVPGHEFAGKVIETGSDILTLQPGDKVTSECIITCGVCESCKAGLMPAACKNFKEIGFGPETPGGMGEYLICDEANLHKIPDDWTYVEGAWTEPISIGYFSFYGGGSYIDASDTALIFGCGPIGISALIVAKTANARIIVADPVETRRARALKLGADYALDPSSPIFREEVKRICGGGGPTVISQCAGYDSAVAEVFQVAGDNCRVNLTGHTADHLVPIEIEKAIWRTMTIKGRGGTDHIMPRTIRFMDRIKRQVDFKSLTTHYFALDDVQKAFDVAVKDKTNALKVMLVMHEGT